MIRWTGLAPQESKIPCPGSLTSTSLARDQFVLEKLLRLIFSGQFIVEKDVSCSSSRMRLGQIKKGFIDMMMRSSDCQLLLENLQAFCEKILSH